jgi:hypothetical protein
LFAQSGDECAADKTPCACHYDRFVLAVVHLCFQYTYLMRTSIARI